MCLCECCYEQSGTLQEERGDQEEKTTKTSCKTTQEGLEKTLRSTGEDGQKQSPGRGKEKITNRKRKLLIYFIQTPFPRPPQARAAACVGPDKNQRQFHSQTQTCPHARRTAPPAAAAFSLRDAVAKDRTRVFCSVSQDKHGVSRSRAFTPPSQITPHSRGSSRGRLCR